MPARARIPRRQSALRRLSELFFVAANSSRMKSRVRFCASVSTIGRSNAKLPRSPLAEYWRVGQVTFRPPAPRRFQIPKPMSLRPSSGPAVKWSPHRPACREGSLVVVGEFHRHLCVRHFLVPRESRPSCLEERAPEVDVEYDSVRPQNPLELHNADGNLPATDGEVTGRRSSLCAGRVPTRGPRRWRRASRDCCTGVAHKYDMALTDVCRIRRIRGSRTEQQHRTIHTHPHVTIRGRTNDHW